MWGGERRLWRSDHGEQRRDPQSVVPGLVSAAPRLLLDAGRYARLVRRVHDRIPRDRGERQLHQGLPRGTPIDTCCQKGRTTGAIKPEATAIGRSTKLPLENNLNV